jgi:hypothetical protein
MRNDILVEGLMEEVKRHEKLIEEILEYILNHEDSEDCQEIYRLIKKECC